MQKLSEDLEFRVFLQGDQEEPWAEEVKARVLFECTPVIYLSHALILQTF